MEMWKQNSEWEGRGCSSLKSVSMRGSDSTHTERETQELQHLRNKSAILHGPAAHADKESERSIEFCDLTVSWIPRPH